MSDEKRPGVIASAGKPANGIPVFAHAVGDGKATDTKTDPNANAGAGQPNAGQPSLELNEDQVTEFLKTKGIEGFDKIDDLKSIVDKSKAPAPAEPTAEEKQKSEEAFQKRMLDLYVSNGGKVEDFVGLQKITAVDLKDLSVSEIRREMKVEGFSDEEIEAVVKERYYQLDPDELEKEVGEEDDAFNKRKELLKKKNTYGSKKLQGHSSHIQQQAKAILKGLRDSIVSQDEIPVAEAQLSSKVDEIAKNLKRDISLELGEVNNQKLDPVGYKITEDDITETANILKDAVKRKQLFFNQDNSLNLSSVFELLLINKYAGSAIKTAFHEGGDRQVAQFRKMFPATNPQSLGLGVAPNSQSNAGKQKGKIASAGKPQVVSTKK